MTQYTVQQHYTESMDPDELSLWNDLESAKREYEAKLAAYRRIGCPELEDRRVELTQNPGGVYARAVFRNEDESLTVFVLKSVEGAPQ